MSELRIWRLGVALLGMIVVAGCATAPSATVALAESYPSERFLSDVGRSSESLADAEDRARGAIAAQIRSRIESETRSVMRSMSRDGKVIDEQEFSHVLSITTSFDHGELIEIDRARSGKGRDGFEAVAFLPRAEAGRVLAADYERAADDFGRRAAVFAATPEHDVPGIAAAYGAVKASFRTMQAREAEMRVVARRSHPRLTADVATWHEVEARRLGVLAGIRVGLELRAPAGARASGVDVSAWAPAFMEALTSLGLSVRGEECDPARYVLELEPAFDLQSVIGVVCRVSFQGQCRECGTDHAWDVRLADRSFAGDGSYEEQAVREAAGKVTAAALAPLLREALAPVLPID